MTLEVSPRKAAKPQRGSRGRQTPSPPTSSPAGKIGARHRFRTLSNQRLGESHFYVVPLRLCVFSQKQSGTSPERTRWMRGLPASALHSVRRSCLRVGRFRTLLQGKAQRHEGTKARRHNVERGALPAVSENWCQTPNFPVRTRPSRPANIQIFEGARADDTACPDL
jgi:hypothetical protein